MTPHCGQVGCSLRQSKHKGVLVSHTDVLMPPNWATLATGCLLSEELGISEIPKQYGAPSLVRRYILIIIS